MLKINFSIIVFMVMFSSLISCKKDENSTIRYNVAIEFEPFVQIFQNEALKRGFNFDLKKMGLVISFNQIPDSRYNSWIESKNPIVLYIDRNIYNSFSYSEKEELILLLLGRTVLQRTLTTEKLNNGDPKSIIRIDGLGLWKQGAEYKRNYYIDELFIPTTPAPDWAESDEGQRGGGGNSSTGANESD